MSCRIPVSNGEVLDKLSILNIKKKYCQNNNQLINICKEISILEPFFTQICINDDFKNLYEQLTNINTMLWSIEDRIRKKEQLKQFDEEFIDLARNVYLTNDQRSNIKKQINILSKSDLIEEKLY